MSGDLAVPFYYGFSSIRFPQSPLTLPGRPQRIPLIFSRVAGRVLQIDSEEQGVSLNEIQEHLWLLPLCVAIEVFHQTHDQL